MKKISVVLVLLLFAGVLSAAVAAKTPQELVAELKADIPQMSVMELQMDMDFGEEFLIIDVRDEGEFAAGRIPGAIHVNFGKLFFTAGNYIPDKDATFIVNCAVGARSTIAISILQELGYTNVIELTGGFRDWMNSGYDVETDHGLFVKK